MSAATVRLSWPGRVAKLPAPRRVRLEPWERHGRGEHRLIFGDNALALDGLLARHAGRVDLVYLDPPFASGASYRARLRTGDGRPSAATVAAFDDRWSGGLAGYLSMMEPRLRRLHELLAPHGSLYLHADPSAAHALKLLLDEIFGPRCFQREIVWRIGWVSGFKSTTRNWIRNHDTILFYTKDPRRFTFHKPYVPHLPGYRRRGRPGKAPGVPVDDVWNAGPAELALTGEDSLDSIQIKSFAQEKTGYATQKNLSLLRRIVAASSNPGDLVLDPFCGSGTTLVAAQGLGRRWIGVDESPAAIGLCRRRLLHGPTPASFQILRPRPVDGDEAEPKPLAARVRLRVERVGEDGLRVRLLGIAGRGISREDDGREAVDAWMVDCSGRGSGFSRASLRAVRAPGGGPLPWVLGPRRLTGSGPVTWFVRVCRSGGAAVDVPVHLARDRRGRWTRVRRAGAGGEIRSG